MRLVLAVVLVSMAVGCASKPRFFQTQAERDEAERQSPAYRTRQAEFKAQREAAAQRDIEKRKEYLSANPTLQPVIAQAITEGAIVRGMNEEQVVLVIGRPSQVNKSTGGFGTWDQWVYGAGIYLLYFKNGILDSWQSRGEK